MELTTKQIDTIRTLLAENPEASPSDVANHLGRIGDLDGRTVIGISTVGAHIRAGEEDDVITAHFLAWKRDPDNNHAPGTTCMTSLRQIESGIRWNDGGAERSAGCGSVMRPSSPTPPRRSPPARRGTTAIRP